MRSSTLFCDTITNCQIGAAKDREQGSRRGMKAVLGETGLLALRILSLACFVQVIGGTAVVGALGAISREWVLMDGETA